MSDTPEITTGVNFTTGIDDLIIVPLVAIALAVRKVLRAALDLLVHIIDWLFPILLQVMRFPLFTLRILGDGIVALLKGIVRILPVGGARRAAWRDLVSAYWAWLRERISYKAFEEWLHHAFEKGMAWVFRTCKSLSPRAALLVLAGAVLWLPISFAVATGMHAVLFAKALVWPAWLQLLHPVATVIAKSKLLVLPVYPAAWPRAKEHPLVQAMIRLWNYLGTLYVVRKLAYRYRQTEAIAAAAADALGHTAAVVGLSHLCNTLLTGLNNAAARVGRASRTAAAGTIALLSKAPLVGGIVQRYATHYGEANRTPSARLSDRVSGFFARWSVKFTAAYYESKERDKAAKGHAGA